MALKWERLLSDRRFGSDGLVAGPEAPKANRTHFEADCDRIIYSEPFRRLSKKTQVHPFPENDHVRTRLTHSLEVASVGRSLAKKVGLQLQEDGHLTRDQSTNLTKIVEAACLAHDIGNPPFGHAGEHAIREWVQSHDQFVLGDLEGTVRTEMIADLFFFEGNAQAFRIAARSDNPQTGYLRLTLATLASMQKYPWSPQDPRTQEKKKCGYFSTEMGMYGELSKELDLEHGSGYVRHPLSFLVEAADDISYRVADIEDAVKMDTLKRSEAIDLYKAFAPNREQSYSDNLGRMRGVAVESLVDEFAAVFLSDYERIMRGDRQLDLKSDLSSQIKKAFKQTKDLYEDTIFAERSKIAYEIGAYKAIGRIIRALVNAVQAVVGKHGRISKSNFVARRTLQLCWDKGYLDAAEQSGRSADYAWWLHQIFDYISGLTDDFARRLSREFEGV